MRQGKTMGSRLTNLKRYMLPSCAAILLFFICGPRLAQCAEDEIGVSREKDKTVYSIESRDENKELQEREREKAWDMLRNMPVIIDRGQTHPMPARPGPVRGEPAQPAPVR